MIAIIPGSFDPITYGHLDIIQRSAENYDKVVVAVMTNSKKVPLFSMAERIELINDSLRHSDFHIDNIEVVSFTGLLAEFVKRYEGKKILVKGLRTVTDYEYEVQMALLNRDLGIETSFMFTNPEFSYVSSSMVKEVASLGGDISKYVPAIVDCSVVAALEAFKNR